MLIRLTGAVGATVVVAVGLGAPASGCAGDGAPIRDPVGDAGVPSPDAAPGDPRTGNDLAFLTPAVELVHGETATIEVRYRGLDGRPISGAPVAVGLVGEAHDSSLSAICESDSGDDDPCLTPETDADGVARATLRAGNVTAVFRISARGPEGETASLDASVGDGGFGGLGVRAPYEGDRSVALRTVHLYVDAACGERPWELLPRPPERSSSLPPATGEATFSGLPASRTYTLLTIARGDRPPGGPRPHLALGCLENVAVVEDERNRVSVPVLDLPAVVDGPFAVSLRIEGAAHPARVGERIRDVADEAVLRAGGEGGLFLDGLATALGAETDAADALDAVDDARGGAGEADLESRILGSGQGARAAVSWLANDFEDRLALVTVGGDGWIDLGTMPELALDAEDLTVGEGSRGLPVDLDGVRLEANARWSLADGAGDLVSSVLELPLGRLSVALLVARLDDAGAASTAELLADRFGCSALAGWVAARPPIDDACDDGCVEAACRAAYAAGTFGLETRLRTFDERRRRVTIDGELDLDIDPGGDVQSVAGPFLEGTWAPEPDEPGDAVSVRLVAVRRGG